jgi:ubiquinone/menaquinone biosynthesis C-methylase UbiE
MDLSKYRKLNEKQKSAETDPFTEKRYEQFARHMPKSAIRILDIGCSTGRGGGALKKVLPDIELHGLDCSKARIAKLPPVYSGRHFGNVTKLPFPNERFDVVLMGEFIEHIQPKDVDSVLSECQRVLRVGGRCMLTTPNPDCWQNRYLGRTVYTISHLSQHFPQDLRLRLRLAGLNKIQVRGSGKFTNYAGDWFPVLGPYGSYLIYGDKI